MKTVQFACETLLPQTPEVIAGQILDLSNWPEFKGYGPLPGIKQAIFEVQTNEIVGTRIRVTNRDGSTHAEEIIEWEPKRCLRLCMYDFSPPLSWLATSFDETWELAVTDRGTKVLRSFAMHPKSILTMPLLWLISLLLRRAIVQHLEDIRTGTHRTTTSNDRPV